MNYRMVAAGTGLLALLTMTGCGTEVSRAPSVSVSTTHATTRGSVNNVNWNHCIMAVMNSLTENPRVETPLYAPTYIPQEKSIKSTPRYFTALAERPTGKSGQPLTNGFLVSMYFTPSLIKCNAPSLKTKYQASEFETFGGMTYGSSKEAARIFLTLRASSIVTPERDWKPVDLGKGIFGKEGVLHFRNGPIKEDTIIAWKEEAWSFTIHNYNQMHPWLSMARNIVNELRRRPLPSTTQGNFVVQGENYNFPLKDITWRLGSSIYHVNEVSTFPHQANPIRALLVASSMRHFP